MHDALKYDSKGVSTWFFPLKAWYMISSYLFFFHRKRGIETIIPNWLTVRIFPPSGLMSLRFRLELVPQTGQPTRGKALGKRKMIEIHGQFHIKQIKLWVSWRVPVNLQFAIEHDHRNSWFTHKKNMWFSMVCYNIPEGNIMELNFQSGSRGQRWAPGPLGWAPPRCIRRQYYPEPKTVRWGRDWVRSASQTVCLHGKWLFLFFSGTMMIHNTSL